VVCYELAQAARSQGSRRSGGLPRVQDDVGTSAEFEGDAGVSGKGEQTMVQSEGVLSNRAVAANGKDDSVLIREMPLKSNDRGGSEASTSGHSHESVKNPRRRLRVVSESVVESLVGNLGSGSGLVSEGLVDSVVEGEEPRSPGGEKTRRPDKALNGQKVADQADVEGTLQQAEAVLTKVPIRAFPYPCTTTACVIQPSDRLE
jgi:hypothetical protein